MTRAHHHLRAKWAFAIRTCLGLFVIYCAREAAVVAIAHSREEVDLYQDLIMTDEGKIQRDLFQKAKQVCLSKNDLSRKGSIDLRIHEIVNDFNRSANYYTTSTCSGRISVISKPVDNPAIKKGGDFFLNSHELIEISSLQDALQRFTSKQNRDAAERLLSVALETGCRNSGATISKNQKYLVAVRSTSFLETPISANESFTPLQNDYLEFLCNQCNQRLESNFIRLEKFHQRVLSLIQNDASQQSNDA